MFGCWWPSRSQAGATLWRWMVVLVAGAVGSSACDAAAMPTQQRVRSHQPARTQVAGESLGDRAEQAPIIIGDHGPGTAAGEHGQLVAQHHDFEILGTTRTNGQTCPRRKKAVRDTRHGASLIGPRRAWSTHTTEYWARTRSFTVPHRVKRPNQIARFSTTPTTAAVLGVSRQSAWEYYS